MRNLVRKSAEENHQKFQQELQILQRERELKQMSKKGKGYKEEYEKFLAQKKEMIDKIYQQKSQAVYQLKREEKQERKPEDERLKEVNVDKARLKSYGF